MFPTILLNFAIQAGCTVGAIYLCGFIIALLNKGFYRNFGSSALTVCYITGFIGTPVHECSHALMCLIFGHKITDMKLFQVGAHDGTLGYVEHSYNQRNWYHRIGNFFIGVAPVTVISTLLFFLSNWLTPGMMGSFVSVNFQGNFFGGIGQIFTILGVYAVTWQFWVYLLLAIFLSLHMTMSGPDIKGSLAGMVSLLVPLLLIDIVLGLVDASLLVGLTNGIWSLAWYMIPQLIFGVVITAIVYLLSFPLARLTRPLRR